MKKFVVCLFAVGLIALFANSANAQCSYRGYGYSPGYYGGHSYYRSAYVPSTRLYYGSSYYPRTYTRSVYSYGGYRGLNHGGLHHHHHGLHRHGYYNRGGVSLRVGW